MWIDLKNMYLTVIVYFMVGRKTGKHLIPITLSYKSRYDLYYLASKKAIYLALNLEPLPVDFGLEYS